MKVFFILFLALFSFSAGFAQSTTIFGSVKDRKTGNHLPFCTISIKGTSQGAITNEEGAFKIELLKPDKDTLILSYLGYKTKIIPAKILIENPDILLESKNVELKEVVVHASDEYLYLIIEKCRKKLLEAKANTAKVYFELETEIEGKPVEMLECYYNGRITGSAIDNLKFKNGRVGLASYNNGYFMNVNTSRAVTLLDLTKPNDYLPFCPFQLKGSKLRKNYKLKMLYDHGEKNIHHLQFSSTKNDNKFFNGEAWIDKETNNIIKINLTCKNASRQPFIPLFPDNKLENVSLFISQTYSKSANSHQLEQTSFKYHLTNINKDRSSTEIGTTGIMYCYNYGKPFLLPYFTFNENETDYRKISFMPFNESFWNAGKGLLFTERQKQKLAFFDKDGLILNFGRFGSKNSLFENNSVFWSDTTRVSLKKNILKEDTLKPKPINNSIPRSSQYNLATQIFLDVNEVGDSVQHFSATVFDAFNTFYYLPEEPVTKCFLNIYFDICEIERRKMEKILHSGPHNPAQIDAVYKETIKNIEAQTALYLKQVQTGRNTKELLKWNAYVLEILKIDNIKTFGLKL